MYLIILNPLKQAAAGLREPPHLARWPQAQHEQQPALVHSLALLGNLQAQHKKQPAADRFTAYTKWPQTEHNQAPQLCWSKPGSVEWAPAQLILWSSSKGGSRWSGVTASPCGWLAWVSPSHWPANSNQGSTAREGCTQPTRRAYLKYPA